MNSDLSLFQTQMSYAKTKEKKTCVSGVGVVCAAGNNAFDAFNNMLAGKRNPIEQPTLFDSLLKKPVFECDSSLLEISFLPENRTLALLFKALNEALHNAAISLDYLKHNKVGVCIGTTVACTLNDLHFYAALRKNINLNTKAITRYLCSVLSLAVADLLNLEDFISLSAANACSSGTNAVAIAHSWINSGKCDVVIAGGADELNQVPYCGFNSLQVMSEDFCLPFDQKRSGLNLGEGAGVLILESESAIIKRKHLNAVSLTASAEGSDAYHLTGPHPEGRGLKAALNRLLDSTGLSPDEISYINAHGTATINNDSIESKIFYDMFGEKIKYSSTKYYTGHTLAAAGAIEAAFCVIGILKSVFPGMPGIEQANDVPVAPAESNVAFSDGHVISTSMAFGGSCAALLFSPLENNKPSECMLGNNTKNTVSLSFNMEKAAFNILKHIAEERTVSEIKGLKCISAGIVSPAGLGCDAFLNMLKNNSDDFECFECGSVKAFALPKQLFNIKDFKKMRRRADKLTLSSYAAALEAFENCPNSLNAKNTALISITSFGAYVTTFRFLDGLIDFGFDAPSPIRFSNSVHNAPVFYISRELGISGPSLSVNGFHNLFVNALELASIYLNEKSYQNVLLIAGDEVCYEFTSIMNMLVDKFDSDLIPFPRTWLEASVAFIFEKGNSTTLPSLEFERKIIKHSAYAMIREALPFAAKFLNFRF